MSYDFKFHLYCADLCVFHNYPLLVQAMSLDHVSDQDIVECLQNCPELDGPLFDVNVLDELCLTDELWKNLDAQGRIVGESMNCSNQLLEELTGLVTPPYSPPTPSSSSMTSDPPSGSSSITAQLSSLTTPPACSTQSSSTISSSKQSPLPVTSQQTPLSSSHPLPGTAEQVSKPHPLSVHTAASPTSKAHPLPVVSQQVLAQPSVTTHQTASIFPKPHPHSMTSQQQLSSIKPHPLPVVPQIVSSAGPIDLSAISTQLSLKNFNGSLQVLKSGETAPFCLLQTQVPQHPSNSNSKELTVPLPVGSQQHQTQEATPPLVVGQKRTHPDSITTSTDLVTQSKLSKKQQRMIKNRESACISRQKKRQYLDSLEARLKEAALKNSALLQENSSLRKQVSLLERENEALRSSRPSSPSSHLMSLKRPAVVMMVVMCFAVAFFSRGHYLHESAAPLSPITALTQVKSRALLSIDTEPKRYELSPNLATTKTTPTTTTSSRGHGGLQGADRNALVPVKSEVATQQLDLMERNLWSLLENPGREMSARQVLSSTSSLPPSACSCPNDSTKMNFTDIKIMNEEMTSCFKLTSPPSGSMPVYHANQNSLSLHNSNHYARRLPSGVAHQTEDLYRNFKKYITQDLDSYYILSFKDHVLMHPSRHNSTHFPNLSVFIPADSDYTSLLQMDCEVLSTKIVRRV